MGEKLLTISELNLEGKFVGFVGDTGKFKYLRLAIPAGDVQVKLPKELRASLGSSLVPGEQIRVDGVSKLDPHTGKITFKANRVKLTGSCPNHNLTPQTKAKIMVCQKLGCMKRGGKGLLSELEKTLCDRGLLDKVTIEHTGCQKRCSSAPNCVVRIGKKQYKKIHPEAIASLLENHFT
ncbi:MAG: (2Fe-2S) ferredoxin domain-containing protein [Goleter apudmare HA4340-LM2]|jgi:(2Fe-2S) ferredoxin|nr:(2Fe-2S) ferredoxin domain-containing protein [Goleter apudmare HA4340-LM2]